MDIGSYKQCGDALNRKTCFFTNSRKYRNVSNNKAFLFYGTDFSLHDLPLPRDINNEDWALLHEESPKNNYLFSFESIMNLFNHTATFKRQSDRNFLNFITKYPTSEFFSTLIVPLITQYLTSIADIESNQYLVNTSEKNRLQKEKDLAPIAYIQSDCVTPSGKLKKTTNI
jgi:alpha-1,3-fucosyltransferase 10